jgi:hypothetical protein
MVAALADTEPIAAQSEQAGPSRFLTLDGNRASYWDVALAEFADDPLAGAGPGSYEFAWLASGKSTEHVRDAHSLYLEQAAELGLPGLVATVLVIFGALWLALAPLRRGDAGPAAVAMPAAVVVYVGAVAIDWMWEATAVTLLALACALSTGGSSGRPRRRSSRQERHTGSGRRRHAGLTVGLGALAVVGIVIQVPGLVATQRIQASQHALVIGRGHQAIELADDAVTAAPWAPGPYSQRAVAEEERDKPELALRDAAEAVSREPFNYLWWLHLAELADRLGAEEVADQAWAQAHILAPAEVPPSPVTG